MSVFNVQNNRFGNHINTLQNHLIYIMRASAVRFPYFYGAGVSVFDAYREMIIAKVVWHQLWGKGYFFYVLCPERDDIYSLEDFYMAGIQIAEHIAHFCGRFQVVMAIHFNVGKQLHIHFIANNIDMDNGHRMDLSKKRMSELKFGISAILVQHHISAIRQRECWNDNILTTTSIGTIMMDCTGLRSKEL